MLNLPEAPPSQAPAKPCRMWDEERESPLAALLTYIAAFLLAIALSAVWPGAMP